MSELSGHNPDADPRQWLQRFSMIGASAVLAAGLFTVSQSQETPTDHLAQTPAPPEAVMPLPTGAPRPTLAPSPTPSPKPPAKRLPFSAVSENFKEIVADVPTLPELGKLFPKSFPDVARQVAYIKWLDAESEITPADLRNFKINRQYIHAFDATASKTRITPRFAMPHWTVDRYPRGVVDFIKEMQEDGKSVAAFEDHDTHEIYQLMDDNRMSAHARSMNAFSFGLEIEATGLYDITPAAWKQAKLWMAAKAREHHFTPSSTTILSHYAGDLIFDNITYRASTGTWHSSRGFSPAVRKKDPPQELILASLDDVAAALG